MKQIPRLDRLEARFPNEGAHLCGRISLDVLVQSIVRRPQPIKRRGSNEHAPVAREEPGGPTKHGRRVTHMFHDVKCEDKVERAVGGERFQVAEMYTALPPAALLYGDRIDPMPSTWPNCSSASKNSPAPHPMSSMFA